jgi:hypothetical protein
MLAIAYHHLKEDSRATVMKCVLLEYAALMGNVKELQIHAFAVMGTASLVTERTAQPAQPIVPAILILQRVLGAAA